MNNPMSRDQFISYFKSVDEKLYDDLNRRGYNFYGGSYFRFADGVCQKEIKDSLGNTIFFIDCWCYIYGNNFPNIPNCIKLSFEARFYINKEENKFCIMELNTKDIDWAEDFLKNFYYAQNCN